MSPEQSISTDSLAITREVLAARTGGQPVVLATVIAALEEGLASVGAKLLYRPDGSITGSLGGGRLERSVLEAAREALKLHRLQTYYITAEGERITRSQAQKTPAYEVMVEPHEASPKLVVVGGGHVGKALAEIGKLCAFHVAVIDDRLDYANRDRFPDADEVICEDFVTALRKYPIDASSYLVCVTRGHKHDEVSLRQVVETPAAYIGMIGSKRRVGAVLQHILEDGVSPEAVARVQTPIGLDIGAETPEEIAVAIMAQIIQVRRGGSGRAMKEARRIKAVGAPA